MQNILKHDNRGSWFKLYFMVLRWRVKAQGRGRNGHVVLGCIYVHHFLTEIKLKTKLGRLFGSLPGYLNHQYDTPTPEVELMYQVYLVSIRNVNAFGCLFYFSI